MTYQNEIQKGFLSAVSTTIDYSLQTASRVLHELLVWNMFSTLTVTLEDIQWRFYKTDRISTTALGLKVCTKCSHYWIINCIMAIAENSGICENYSSSFIIIHLCPSKYRSLWIFDLSHKSLMMHHHARTFSTVSAISHKTHETPRNG